MKRFEIFFGIVKIPIDFIMTILAFIFALELRRATPAGLLVKKVDESKIPEMAEYLQFSFVAAAVLIVIYAFGHMYSLRTTTTYTREAKSAAIFSLIWTMTLISYFFVTDLPFSRLAMIYSWLLTPALIILGRGIIRWVQRRFLKAGIGRRNVAFIGSNRITTKLRKVLSKNPSFKILGVMSIKEFEKAAKKHRVDEVIQTRSENESVLELCDLHHVHYSFVPDLMEVRHSNVDVRTIGGIPILSLRPTPLDGWGKVIKRITDIVGSLIGMIILSPIFIITAIAIKLDSKGPVLFNKLDDGAPVKRVGQRGKLFRFSKFRSMTPGTHSERYTKLAHKDAKTGPIVKIDNDPRITRVGKFIRKYSIDELPSLWNVFIGNMSLVGPRPHLPEEVAKYQKHHRFVFTIKPGITGLAAIANRDERLNFENEVRLDRYYIENWSFWMDLRIIFKTLVLVVQGHNE